MISKSTVVKDTSLGCLEYGQRVFSCDFQKFPADPFLLQVLEQDGWQVLYSEPSPVAPHSVSGNI